MTAAEGVEMLTAADIEVMREHSVRYPADCFTLSPRELVQVVATLEALMAENKGLTERLDLLRALVMERSNAIRND